MSISPTRASQSTSTIGRPIVLTCLCVTVAISWGCTRWMEISDNPSTDRTTETLSVQAEERVPVLLSAVQVNQNGAPLTPSAEFERRLLSELQATHLFSEYVQQGYGRSPSGNKFVSARLAMEETVDPHAGGAAWKGFLIGASMFLLSPVVPLEYDYESRMTLELERWDGLTTRYNSSTRGTAFYYLFGATPLAIQELKGHVTDASLTKLMQQLVQDTNLYLAGSAPLPAASRSTITVKAKPVQPPSMPVSTSAGSPAP